MSKSVTAVRHKGVLVLAWASFGFAVVGGVVASGTFVGDAIRVMFGILPWGWVSVVALITLVAATAVDLFMDGVPNRVALYSAIVIPSVATATPGRFGDALTRGATSMMDWVNDGLSEWLGIQSAVGIAITCVAASLILARRVVKGRVVKAGPAGA